MSAPIAILGAGSWGTALALLLANNNNAVILWGRDKAKMADVQKTRTNHYYLPNHTFPPAITVTADLNVALNSQVETILLAVPSGGFRETLIALKPYLHAQSHIVWATKGLEHGTGKWLHEIIEEELGKAIPTALLSGPSFAKEVAKGLPTAITLASRFPEFAQRFSQRIHSKTFRVYTNNDVVGVELGGAAKNVLAIAVGIADGLAIGANARAALMTRGLTEIIRLGEALHCRTNTLIGLAGLGDLILTCTDNQSRNRRFGLALAKGLSQEQAQHDIGQVVEGVDTAAELLRVATPHAIELPITYMVNAVLQQNITPKEAVASLLARDPKAE